MSKSTELSEKEPVVFHGSPNDQQPGETDVAYFWFLIFLRKMSSEIKDIAKIADEKKQELVDKGEDEGFIPNGKSVYSWSAKHQWIDRRNAYYQSYLQNIKEGVDEALTQAYEQFFQNDLALILGGQLRVMEELSEAEAKGDMNLDDKTNIKLRIYKYYDILRGFAKESLISYMNKKRLEQAESAR